MLNNVKNLLLQNNHFVEKQYLGGEILNLKIKIIKVIISISKIDI